MYLVKTGRGDYARTKTASLVWTASEANEIGKRAVDYLVASLSLKSREDAVTIGNQVLQKGIFFHVVHDHPFLDKYLFYTFSDYWVCDGGSRFLLF